MSLLYHSTLWFEICTELEKSYILISFSNVKADTNSWIIYGAREGQWIHRAFPDKLNHRAFPDKIRL